MALSYGIDTASQGFVPYHRVGGNSPWFQGPNVFGVDSDVPVGCSVDTAAFVSRHGSRYPDASAYSQWTSLASKIDSSNYSATGVWSFLPTWAPALPYPAQEISQISIGGYKELYDMGVDFRYRYRHLYQDNTVFEAFANQYPASPRVIDSARLFVRGFMGPNSTLGNIYVLPSSDPRAVANSLAPSDSCPTYKDDGGGEELDTYQDIYLPPIANRINRQLGGNVNFSTTDVSIFPYLCGFETQINGVESPWCKTFSEKEFREYEYAQDLRYWYGSGKDPIAIRHQSPGSGKNSTFMLPVLKAIIQRFQNGPNQTYINSNGQAWKPSPLMAMFTNDGQINQLASIIGVFDEQEALPATSILEERIYVASHFVPMKGTVGFERLSCEREVFVRILLNNVVYPVPTCQSGPGRSCPLSQYASLIEKKAKAAGGFAQVCNLNVTANLTGHATFLVDNALPFEYVVKP